MTDREVLKLALEALETELCIDWTNNDEFNASAEKMHEAITAIHEALAQPAQRPWVGLTDTEIKAIIGSWGGTPIKGYTRNLFDQIEAKLKELNT